MGPKDGITTQTWCTRRYRLHSTSDTKCGSGPCSDRSNAASLSFLHTSFAGAGPPAFRTRFTSSSSSSSEQQAVRLPRTTTKRQRASRMSASSNGILVRYPPGSGKGGKKRGGRRPALRRPSPFSREGGSGRGRQRGN